MDRELFNRLVQETKGWVFSTAYNILKNRSDAEDIMQEVFLSLYDNYEKIENKDAVYGWIKRVAVNKSLNYARKNVFVQLKDFAFDYVFKTENEEGEKILYNEQMMKNLQEGLDLITPEHRAIIILREIEGFSYEEIAEQLGLKVGTVMSRLFYARKKIRAYLEKRK